MKRCSLSKSSALRRRHRARAKQRGAAIFVVLLVLTILTAIGMFATRAAGLNQRLSGYARQGTQTGYVAEYGALLVFDEITGDRAGVYVDEILKGHEQCAASSLIEAGTGKVPCYKQTLNEMQNSLNSEGASAKIVDPSGETFGVSNNALADFSVDMTDLYAGQVEPGDDQTGLGGQRQTVQITLTSSGQLRPNVGTTGGTCQTADEQASAQLSGTRAARMIVTTTVWMKKN